MSTSRDKQKQERLLRSYSTDRPEIPLMAFWRRWMESRKAKSETQATSQEADTPPADTEQSSKEEEAPAQPPKRRVIRVNRNQVLMTLSVLAFMAWWQLYLKTL